MRAKICGVGVGPGDPELITRKAEHITRTADVIAFPGKTAESSAAFRIAAAAVPEIREKELLALDMPMARDTEMLNLAHRRAAEALMQCADQGKRVAYLILGDCTIYSSFTYLDRILRKEGYETEWINGVPSFCAAAARARVSLAEGEKELRILPGTALSENTETGVLSGNMPTGNTEAGVLTGSMPAGNAGTGVLSGNLPGETAGDGVLRGTVLEENGNTVILKAGKYIKEIRELSKAERTYVVAAENVGMPEERILFGAEEIPEEMGYFSLVILCGTKKDT